MCVKFCCPLSLARSLSLRPTLLEYSHLIHRLLLPLLISLGFSFVFFLFILFQMDIFCHAFICLHILNRKQHIKCHIHTNTEFELTVYKKKMRDFGVYRWIFRHIYFTSVAQRFVHNCYFGKWIFVFFFVISRFVQFLPSKIIHEIRLHFTNFQFSWLNRKQNIQCEMCLHWTKKKRN